MPPKDPELIALRKELEDLIAKCQVITTSCSLIKLYIFYIYTYLLCHVSFNFLNKSTLYFTLHIQYIFIT